jgi:hypothetical protein
VASEEDVVAILQISTQRATTTTVTSQNFTNFGMSNENKILCLIVDLIDIRKELKLFVVIKKVFLK